MSQRDEASSVSAPTKHKKFYLSVRAKFIISLVFALAWVAFSAFIARAWYYDLADFAGPVAAVLIICGIAFIPGFMNAFLIMSLLLDRQPELGELGIVDEPMTVLIAAYNEEERLYEALRYLARQTYQGPLRIIVVNNASTDKTALEALRARADFGLDLLLLTELKQGKFHALNRGLSEVETDYFITLDADTLVHHQGIAYLVARLKASPADVAAVAGSVLAKNSRENLLTRIQEWDYFLSIASIKRMQGLYQGTLVAQGAFSLYRTKDVRAIGGWSDAIGEDIVFTWKLLGRGAKVFFEPMAVAFTTVPATLGQFFKQRSRWARGMIEGIRAVKPWRQPSFLHKFSTGLDLLIPFVDFSYTLFWIPGLILAVGFQNYVIVGPMLLLVFPLTIACFSLLYFYQKNRVFKRLDLRVRQNYLGFIVFMIAYQALMSPVSLYGYAQELFNARRVWK